MEILIIIAVLALVGVTLLNISVKAKNFKLEKALGLAQQRITNVEEDKKDVTSKHLSSYSEKESMTQELREALEKINEIEGSLGDEREKNRVLISQKKSSETRLGQISEHLVPFLKDCPYDPKNMSFCGNPIDYLVYDYDQGKIVFVEVKSGNSKASKRQKTIKNIIKSGRVYYAEMRINTRGVKVTESKNEE